MTNNSPKTNKSPIAELKEAMAPYIDDPKSDFNAYIVSRLEGTNAVINISDRQLSEYITRKVGENPTYESVVDFLQKTVNLISVDDEIHIYDVKEGIYVPTKNYEVGRILIGVLRIIAFGWKSGFESEVIQLLKRKVPHYENSDMNKKVFMFKNNALDLESLQLVPFDPKYLATQKSQVDPKAGDTPVFDEFLSSTFNGDEDKIRFVWFWLAVHLQIDRAFNILVFMYSSGASGKSTLLNVIKAILGVANVTGTSIKDFNGSFGLESMISKYAWILEESGPTINDFANLKSLAEGNTLSVNRKNKPIIEVEFKLKITLSFNQLPVPELTVGFSRRLVLLSFPNTYIDGKADLNLSEKLRKEQDSIAYELIACLRKLKTVYGYDLSKVVAGKVKEETQDYLDGARSPVYLFLKEKCTKKIGERTSRSDILNSFNDFLNETNTNSKGFSKPKRFWGEFTKQYQEIYGSVPSFSKSGIEYVDDITLK